MPESRQEPAPSPVDLPGAALTVVSLAGITYGLIEGPSRGWTSSVVLGTIAIGVLAGIGFVVEERRSGEPMVPLSIFRQRQFVVSGVLTLLVYAALGGALFLLPLDLEVVDGYSALDAGLALIPLTLVMLVLSAPSGRLSARIGPRLQMSVGPVVVGTGLALLARAAGDSSYAAAVLPGILAFALGLAITVAPLTATALGSVGEDRSGLASAVNNDVARIGGLVAVAVLPALASLTGNAYLHQGSMAHGFRVAAFITAAWCAVGGAVAAVGIRNPAPARGATTPEPLDCALDAVPLIPAAGARSVASPTAPTADTPGVVEPDGPAT